MRSEDLPRWRRYLRFWGPDIAADVEDELQFHVDELKAEYQASGASAADAERMARERFGDYGGYQQVCRTMGEARQMKRRRREIFSTLVQDARFGVRQLSSNAIVSVAAILTLALGIGANTSIFSVVNTVLLSPLPYREADRLYVTGMSMPEFLDLQQREHTLESVTAWASNMYTIRGDTPEQIRGAIVMPEFFELLADPVLGRAFTDAESVQPLAVISDGLWKRRFGGGADVIGRTIDLNGAPHTIIGVMPHSFQYPDVTFDVWVPLPHAMLSTPEQMQNRSLRIFRVIARADSAATLAALNTDLERISRQLQAEYPTTNGGVVFQFDTMSNLIVDGGMRRALTVLLGAVGLVLLIACVNVANLMLGMTAVRAREIAVRQALGAPRGRVLRQLLTESLVLALAGGMAGIGLAALILRVLPRFAVDVPRISEVHLDVRVLIFALAVTAGTAMLFGIFPALQGMRGDVRDVLQEGGRGGIGSRRGGGLRAALVAGEVALSIVVLVGAGLLTQSLIRVMNQDIGINAENLVSANVGLFHFDTPAERTLRLDRVLERVGSLSNVQIVGASSALPPRSGQRGTGFTVPGRIPDAAEQNGAFWIGAVPDYFKAVGAPLVRGRAFEARDGAGAAPVAIINESLARTLFGNGDPVGRQIQLTNEEAGPELRTIVGVAGDIRYNGIEDAEAVSAIYTPFAQTPFLWANLMIRTTEPAERLARPLRAAIASVDARMVPGSVDQHGVILSDLYAQRRFITLLLASFAILAIVLAAVGIYGVIANSVTQRKREIGVRIALGANPGTVLRAVVVRALALVASGLALGLIASFWATRVLTAMLYGVRSTDATTFIAGSILMILVAVAASAAPAWRAARLDPLVVLREQ